MPRAESTKMSTQFYHSSFAGQPYLADTTQASPTLPAQVPPQSAPPTNSAPKKKHVCPTCDRAFTTSGHLARHSRVHTGERNHKCPFPGCETRCSRQDNLQQQSVFFFFASNVSVRIWHGRLAATESIYRLDRAVAPPALPSHVPWAEPNAVPRRPPWMCRKLRMCHRRCRLPRHWNRPDCMRTTQPHPTRPRRWPKPHSRRRPTSGMEDQTARRRLRNSRTRSTWGSEATNTRTEVGQQRTRSSRRDLALHTYILLPSRILRRIPQPTPFLTLPALTTPLITTALATPSPTSPPTTPRRPRRPLRHPPRPTPCLRTHPDPRHQPTTSTKTPKRGTMASPWLLTRTITSTAHPRDSSRPRPPWPQSRNAGTSVTPNPILLLHTFTTLNPCTMNIPTTPLSRSAKRPGSRRVECEKVLVLLFSSFCSYFSSLPIYRLLFHRVSRM